MSPETDSCGQVPFNMYYSVRSGSNSRPYGREHPVPGRDGVQSPVGVAAAITIPMFACFVGVHPYRETLGWWPFCENVVIGKRYVQCAMYNALCAERYVGVGDLCVRGSGAIVAGARRGSVQLLTLRAVRPAVPQQRRIFRQQLLQNLLSALASLCGLAECKVACREFALRVGAGIARMG